MINLDNVYKNTCCMCCGIPLVSKQKFQKPDGTIVPCTVDHVLLKSLGGPNTTDNLVLMCFDCNQTRGNLFAELNEFIDWYWSDLPLPLQKNFSYLYEKPKETKTIKIKKPTVLKSKNISVPIGDVIMVRGVKHQEYLHPLFGKSLIKIEE